MSSPEPQPGLWQISHWISGIAIAFCGWLWREISNKASKEELIGAVNMLRDQHAAMLERVDEHYDQARESRELLYRKVDEINRSLGATMVSLSRLQGQLDRNEEGHGR